MVGGLDRGGGGVIFRGIMKTRTGNFSIGFRRGGAAWQQDLGGLAKWGSEMGFEAIDLGRATAEDVRTLAGAGLQMGSVDLIEFGKLMQNDAGARRELVARNVAYVGEAARLGARAFFACVIPGDASRKRSENYALAVESFSPIAAACAANGARLAIEGWPGPGPYLANLCCTPETCRSLLKELGAGAGLNYDPSHLIRLGVDHVRFLREFLPAVVHVHAKDTELIPEAVYEYGLYQSSPTAKPHRYGDVVWRYTIPGSGQARWGEIFKILAEGGYRSVVSVELEDEHFNGTEEGEKSGLGYSLAFLRGA